MGNKQVRVLHVVHGLPRGGLERGVVNLCNRLPGSEFTQGVCCLDIRGEMADQISPQVALFELNRARIGIRSVGVLSRLFRGWAPDVIHCRNWNTWPDALAAHRLASVSAAIRPSLVWSFHGFPDTAAMPWRRQILSRGLVRFTDHLVAVCQDSAGRFASESGLSKRPFDVLYNGVDCDLFTPARDRRAARRRLGLDEDTLLVLTTGSLTPIKNHEILVDAANWVRNRLSRQVRFLFLGEGAQRSAIEMRIREHRLEDCITLPGACDRVVDYLQSADVFVLPSRLEGMSNAILEAMACGLPVIAFRTGGNPELVVHDETGLLPHPQTAPGLGTAIQTLLEDEGLRALMGAAARQRALTHFSIDAMMDRYARFYRNAAGTRAHVVA